MKRSPNTGSQQIYERIKNNKYLDMGTWWVYYFEIRICDDDNDDEIYICVRWMQSQIIQPLFVVLTNGRQKTSA